MKLSIYGTDFLILIGKALERDGHCVFFNEFSPDIDLIIIQSMKQMYKVYRLLKSIRKNKIKIINFVLDIPPYRLEKRKGPRSLIRTENQLLFDDQRANNTLFKYFHQTLFHIGAKYLLLSKILGCFYLNSMKGSGISKFFSRFILKIFNKTYINRISYQIFYRNFLKKSDLILCVSKYTQYCLKKFLKLDSKLCYQCVDSDFLLSLELPFESKYDAISIGRFVDRKRHEIFVKAAKKLRLKILVIGSPEEPWIKLDCPRHYFHNIHDVWRELSKAHIFVDCSIFEGFGMPPIEAAYLNKIVIASDTFIHREIIGDYALYFKKEDVDDLVDKIQVVRNRHYTINKRELQKIKEKYSIQEAKKRLLNYIESEFKIS